MKLITDDLQRRLLQNGAIRRTLDETGEAAPDFIPIVKLHMPDTGFVWLLTEVDPGYPETAFGLCDLAMGFPELGSVYLPELEDVRGPMGLKVERYPDFAPTFTISVYARAAWTAGYITEDRALLEAAAIARHDARGRCA